MVFIATVGEITGENDYYIDEETLEVTIVEE